MAPLSVNQAWQGKRYKTSKYTSFEHEFAIRSVGQKIPEGDLKVEFVFGMSKAMDIDNPLKVTIDCLQKKHGFNDNRIMILHVKKEVVKKGNEFIEYKISKL